MCRLDFGNPFTISCSDLSRKQRPILYDLQYVPHFHYLGTCSIGYWKKLQARIYSQQSYV